MKPPQLSADRGTGTEPLLRKIPFFACLSDDEYAAWRRNVQIKNFNKNEVILLEEQTSEYMYLVYSGRVKAVMIDREGRESILAIHEKGDYFGEMALLDGKTSPATVVAMEPAVIGLIRKSDFEKYLSGHPAALKALVALLCSRLREAWSTLQILTSADAEHRIRAMLRHVGAHYGEDTGDGTLIRMKLTHQDLAHYAGVSRETVTRLLDRLKKAGEIEIPGRRSLLLKPGFFKIDRL